MTRSPSLSDSELHAMDIIIGRMITRFPDVRAETVRQIVNTTWDEFTGTPIRNFVPVLVERSAREQLRLQSPTPLPEVRPRIRDFSLALTRPAH
jgi:hypothetical protein